MAINGILTGSSGKFQVTYNGALQLGAVPQWSAGDPDVALAPAADGFTCDVGIPAAGLATPSFILSATATSSDGSMVVASAGIPVLTPPPAPATAGVIDQIA